MITTIGVGGDGGDDEDDDDESDNDNIGNMFNLLWHQRYHSYSIKWTHSRPPDEFGQTYTLKEPGREYFYNPQKSP